MRKVHLMAVVCVAISWGVSVSASAQAARPPELTVVSATCAAHEYEREYYKVAVRFLVTFRGGKESGLILWKHAAVLSFRMARSREAVVRRPAADGTHYDYLTAEALEGPRWREGLRLGPENNGFNTYSQGIHAQLAGDVWDIVPVAELARGTSQTFWLDVSIRTGFSSAGGERFGAASDAWQSVGRLIGGEPRTTPASFSVVCPLPE